MTLTAEQLQQILTRLCNEGHGDKAVWFGAGTSHPARGFNVGRDAVYLHDVCVGDD